MLVRSIRNLYQGAWTVPIVNGYRGVEFPVQSRVRQEDPMSCVLYILAIEPLARINSARFLEVWLDRKFSFKAHQDKVKLKMAIQTFALTRLAAKT